MLPCVLIPLILLFAVSQVLPPSFRFEVTSSRLVCVFLLLVVPGWYEVVRPRLMSWKDRRSAVLRDRRRILALEAAKWRKEATRRCRNCLTAYRDQNPAGGRFMCTYCGHVSRRPVLDIPNIASGIVGPGIQSNGVVIKGGITQIGIPVASLYGGKNSKTWNGKGWPKEWSVSDSWLRGTTDCLGSNGNVLSDVFGGTEQCSACETYPRVVIFLLRLVGTGFFWIRWVWRRVFRRGSLGDEEGLSSGAKVCSRKSEEGCNSQWTKGEKARRKAEEKRLARLEKEMQEEEERKQREEVARLVEERRRLREAEEEEAAQSEREIRREREVERRRQDKVKEKEKGLGKDKPPAEGEEARKQEKEHEKKGDLDKKGENEKRESPKILNVADKKGAKNCKVFGIDSGLKNNEQGLKGGVNSILKAGGCRHFVPLKGPFQSPSKSSAWQSSSITSSRGKNFGMDLGLGMKSSKLVHSADTFPLSTNVLIGPTKSTQNTGSAWNRTNWAKPWGKESNTIAEDFFRQENNATNGKGEKLVGNVTGKTPGIKQPQPPVGVQLQPLLPVSSRANSWEHHTTSSLTSCLTASSAVVGSPLEQKHQTEDGKKSVSPVSSSPGHICFGSAVPVLLPPVDTMPIFSNSVPDCTSQAMKSSYNSMSPPATMSPHKLLPRVVSSSEDLVAPPNPVSLHMPVSESMSNFSLGLETKLISGTQTPRVSSPICASVSAPIQRPAPIESPISKLLPSELVDEVHVAGDQIHPITEPWGLRSLSLDGGDGVFKWQMWDTPQLGQGNLPSEGKPSWLPVGNGVLEQEKDFLHPLPERNLLSPFEPESRLPSCLFTPLQNPNDINPSSEDYIDVASGSSSNSLWRNQPAFESVEGSWNNVDHHRVSPSFLNGGTQGEVQDSVISTNHHSYDQIPTSAWLKSGIDGMEKGKWSAEAAVGSSSWSSTIKAPTRPHIGGIYTTPDAQSVWSYK